MATIYFEEKGEQLIKRMGMTKVEFARRMGIRKQNVKALFKSKNLETIYKVSQVLGVPFEMLIGYTTEPAPGEIPPVLPEEDFDEQEFRQMLADFALHGDLAICGPEMATLSMNGKSLEVRFDA